MKEAGRFRLDEGPPEEVGMLMTSMIDVIFILLAFFVCVTEIKKGKLDVDVPEVPTVDEASESERDVEPLQVEVTADDRVFVAGELAADEESLARLLALAVERAGPELPVSLAGDKEAKNGTMMRVVSHLSRAGIRHIEFAVEGGG